MNNDNKKWYEKIPPQGVLCKLHNGDIVRISSTKFNGQGAIYLIESQGNYFDIDSCTPLTAEEIWQFMPWQSMDSAPKDNSTFLIRYKFTKAIRMCWYLCGAFRTIENVMYSGGKLLDSIEWLPLPKVEK